MFTTNGNITTESEMNVPLKKTQIFSTHLMPNKNAKEGS